MDFDEFDSSLSSKNPDNCCILSKNTIAIVNNINLKNIYLKNNIF